MVWWVVVTEIRSRREASPVLPTVTCVSVVAVTGIRSQRVVSPGLPIVMMIPEGLGTSVQTIAVSCFTDANIVFCTVQKFWILNSLTCFQLSKKIFMYIIQNMFRSIDDPLNETTRPLDMQ